MQHLEQALEQFPDWKGQGYINLDNNVISFTIQDGPIKEVGVNGIQVTDMLSYLRQVYQSLNSDFPCLENEITIKNIECGIETQLLRTKNRQARGVEGYNKV